MKITPIKAILSIIVGGLAAYLGALTIPLVILIIVMLTDYITGMTRAWITKSFSSRVGVAGIVKKVLYLVLVAVGMVIDFLISGALSQVGVNAQMPGVIGMIVTVWLIINELISILENLSQAGVPIPAFLVKLVKRLKIETEAKGNATTQDPDQDEE